MRKLSKCKSIFHYTKLDNFKSIVQNKKLWLSNSDTFRDKFDRSFSHIYINYAIADALVPGLDKMRDISDYDSLCSICGEVLKPDFYATSFSFRPDNKFLWEHYADRKTGIVFEINKPFLENYLNYPWRFGAPYSDVETKDQPLSLLQLRPVFYGYNSKVLRRILAYINTFKIGCGDNVIFSNRIKMLHSLLSGVIKSKLYRNEEEIRLVYLNLHDDKLNHDFRHSLHLLDFDDRLFDFLGLSQEVTTPHRHIELNLSPAFNSNLITKVYYRNDDTKNQLIEILNNSPLQQTRLFKVLFVR